MPPCEGGYKEFRIGDLFDVDNTWIYGKNKQYITRYKSQTQKSIAVISGITINNGVNYYTEDKLSDNEIFSDCLTISTRGEYSGTVTYHDGKFALANNILVMVTPNWSKEAKLYLASVISKLGYGGYSGYPKKETLAKDFVCLPTTSTGDIDFQFMESRMRELEEERMRELEAYLTAAGFADCSLSPTEEEALRKFSNGEVKFTSYRIGDHFKKLALGIHKKFNKSTDVSKESTAEFNIPLVNAKHGNNGIMYYGKECDYDTAEMTIDIVNDGAISTGDVYAQPQKTGVLYNAYLVKCISHEMDSNSIFYFSTAIGKSIKLKYGYDKKASWERVQNDSMILPTTSNGEIDYDFMGTYISAIKKQIIQQLKDFIAKEHATYQQVIEKTK